MTVPVTVGANFTPNVKLCPGLSVSGRVKPVTLKPVPVILAWDTLTAVPPELVKLSVLLALLLTDTLPKLREDDDTLRTPGVVPVPDKEMSTVELEASLITEIFPLAEPLDCGVNVTLKLVLLPAPRLKGNVRPVTPKAALLGLACIIVTLDPPEFVRLTCSVCASPT